MTWKRSPTSDADSMSLPISKTCGDCARFNGCKKLFGCNPENEVCDWSPCRFTEIKLQVQESTHNGITQ